MDPLVIGLLIVAALVIVGVVLMISRGKQRDRLKQQFGSEYDRQVAATGSKAKADAELLKREKRIEKLDIRPLHPAAREEFMGEWQEVQARFVDDPERSIAFADALVGEVMKARGYPVEDFEQRAADISVEHPQLVQNYRAAHEIAIRHRQGQGDTEDLRAAFLGYRAMFEELLHAEAPEPAH